MEEQQEFIIGELSTRTEKQQNYILDLIEYDAFSEEESEALRGIALKQVITKKDASTFIAYVKATIDFRKRYCS